MQESLNTLEKYESNYYLLSSFLDGTTYSQWLAVNEVHLLEYLQGSVLYSKTSINIVHFDWTLYLMMVVVITFMHTLIGDHIFIMFVPLKAALTWKLNSLFM